MLVVVTMTTIVANSLLPFTSIDYESHFQALPQFILIHVIKFFSIANWYTIDFVSSFFFSHFLSSISSIFCYLLKNAVTRFSAWLERRSVGTLSAKDGRSKLSKKKITWIPWRPIESISTSRLWGLGASDEWNRSAKKLHSPKAFQVRLIAWLVRIVWFVETTIKKKKKKKRPISFYLFNAQ